MKGQLVKINAFRKSKKKLSLKIIHLLRLEVKHLEAFVELMTVQNNFGVRSEIPDRLDKLYHEAGKLRKLELEMSVIQSITKNKRLSKPTLFIEHLKSSKKKTSKKLCKKRNAYPAFKLKDFVKYPGVKLSSHTWQQFLAARASSMLDLLSQDIISDIRSLHQLRKILKSILYVLPLCKNGVKPLRVFLKKHKKFIKSVESKIGSVHDSNSFVTSLEKKYYIIHASEERALIKVKQKWQKDIKRMRESLQALLPAIRQVALDLRDRSTGNLNSARLVSI
ncbi:MAG TPA: hypothetical protein VGZ71_03465 [Puia sp.]|nr:hypothetical protein [Puia sp.]